MSDAWEFLPGATPVSRRGLIRHAGAALGVALGSSAFANAEPTPRKPGELVLSRLPGLPFLPSHVMEKHKLVERHAARLGLPGLSVRWMNVSTSDQQREMLLNGRADINLSGLGPLLILWDMTKGGVKGILSCGSMPLFLVSADPRVRTLRDIGAQDRIAVPVLRISNQAVLLQLAASQLYGPDAWNHFDRNCVAMSHPQAYFMLRHRDSAVRLHFAAPPYQFYAKRRIRNAHIVTTSAEIVGSVQSNIFFLGTTRFAEDNPLVLQALRAAALEAKRRIEKDTQDAVACYRELSGDKSEAADILEALAEPDMMDWRLAPMGTHVMAQHLHRVGVISRKPESWRDYFLPEFHDLVGS